jgi:hypothetical protein
MRVLRSDGGRIGLWGVVISVLSVSTMSGFWVAEWEHIRRRDWQCGMGCG